MSVHKHVLLIDDDADLRRTLAEQLMLIDDFTVEIGRDANRRCLRQIAQCRQSGIWPGFSDGFESIGLPDWAVRKAMKA